MEIIIRIKSQTSRRNDVPSHVLCAKKHSGFVLLTRGMQCLKGTTQTTNHNALLQLFIYCQTHMLRPEGPSSGINNKNIQRKLLMNKREVCIKTISNYFTYKDWLFYKMVVSLWLDQIICSLPEKSQIFIITLKLKIELIKKNYQQQKKMHYFVKSLPYGNVFNYDYSVYSNYDISQNKGSF